METDDNIKVTKEQAENNPFLVSKHFTQLLAGVAQIAKVVVVASSNPGEAANGITSLVMTILKNIPDPAWDLFVKVVEEKKGGAADDLFKHLTAIRSHPATNDDKCSIVEVGLERDHPPVNAPMPSKPC